MRAFFAVIRAGETSATDDDAYRALFGWQSGKPGHMFGSFADHPRVAVMSRWGWTSAAGAYQAMAAVPGKVKTDTWGDFIRSTGPHDFSPISQDLFAAWCIRRRGAIDAVIHGRLWEAIDRCKREWASLPGSPYGQPTRTAVAAALTYSRFGGTGES